MHNSDVVVLGSKTFISTLNELTPYLKFKISFINENSIKKPININNNYLIIKVNQKRIINEEFDENKIVKEIIKIEKDKQYQNFSQIY